MIFHWILFKLLVIRGHLIDRYYNRHNQQLTNTSHCYIFLTFLDHIFGPIQCRKVVESLLGLPKTRPEGRLPSIEPVFRKYSLRSAFQSKHDVRSMEMNTPLQLDY